MPSANTYNKHKIFKNIILRVIIHREDVVTFHLRLDEGCGNFPFCVYYQSLGKQSITTHFRRENNSLVMRSAIQNQFIII